MSALVDQPFLLMVSKAEDLTVTRGAQGKVLTSALTLLRDGGVMGSGDSDLPSIVDARIEAAAALLARRTRRSSILFGEDAGS